MPQYINTIRLILSCMFTNKGSTSLSHHPCAGFVTLAPCEIWDLFLNPSNNFEGTTQFGSTIYCKSYRMPAEGSLTYSWAHKQIIHHIIKVNCKRKSTCANIHTKYHLYWATCLFYLLFVYLYVNTSLCVYTGQQHPLNTVYPHHICMHRKENNLEIKSFKHQIQCFVISHFHTQQYTKEVTHLIQCTRANTKSRTDKRSCV